MQRRSQIGSSYSNSLNGRLMLCSSVVNVLSVMRYLLVSIAIDIIHVTGLETRRARAFEYI